MEFVWYSELTKKAFRIAYKAHKDQVDKSGMPYILHPLAVANQAVTELEIATALLHDVLEDSKETLETLKSQGMPKEVLEALALLEKKPGQGYMEYIDSIRGNPLAVSVKRWDLLHNLCEKRKLEDSMAQERREKYKEALRVLEGPGLAYKMEGQER